MAKQLCKHCGIRPAMTSGKNKKTGRQYYQPHCKTCYKYPDLKDKAKQTQCDVCHQKYHPIQLDIDHIDGNSGNCHYDNYQILCSNCHRLKSYMQRDYTNNKRRKA